MNEIITAEIRFFMGSFLWGVLLFVAYDGMRIFRRVFSHKKWMVALEDILFWIVAGCLIFGMMYRMNHGIIRYYSIMAMIFGMKLYQIYLSKKVVDIVSIILLYIKKQLCRLFGLLLIPIRKLARQGKRLYRFLGEKVGKKVRKVLSIPKKYLKKWKNKFKIKKEAKKKNKGIPDQQMKEKGPVFERITMYKGDAE